VVVRTIETVRDGGFPWGYARFLTLGECWPFAGPAIGSTHRWSRRRGRRASEEICGARSVCARPFVL